MKYIGIISYLILNFDLNWSFIDSNVSLHEINPPPKKRIKLIIIDYHSIKIEYTIFFIIAWNSLLFAKSVI